MTEPYQAPSARRAAPLVDLDQDVTSFPGAIVWTILGTIIPGLGLLRAKRLFEGITILLFFLVLVAGVGYLSYERDFAKALLTSPITLLGIGVLCGILAVIIVAIIIGTYLTLRPHIVTPGQRISGAIFVLVLSFVVCLPLAVGTGYSLSQAGIVH